RAFADLADFVNLTAHLAGPDTRILAMKGLHPADEIARIPQGFALDASLPLHVPGLDAERHLIIVKRT
ncbi:MAG: class I SAM-dependent methyltransferase, partial [Proteobacteria bacterium]|nr:class I SAM-dependent methyltransferase [Pseudomonadota bacterium]